MGFKSRAELKLNLNLNISQSLLFLLSIFLYSLFSSEPNFMFDEISVSPEPKSLN